jgi:curved DNA-binding protein CbpA
MKFYQFCKTYEDLKKEYHRLARIYHPDITGDQETMKIVNNEYDIMFLRLKDVHVNKDGEYYNKATTDTADTFKNIINSIIHFVDVTIEVCGSWIWVSGNTRIYRDDFKKLGFYWSQNKAAWYWHSPEEIRKFRKTPVDMNVIRNMYGSEIVNNEPYQAIAQ